MGYNKTNRNIRLLYLHNFLEDFRPYNAIAVLYFAAITGSLTLGMTVFSIVMVSSAVFEIPTGVISDLVGRRRTFILGSLMSVIAVILYALSNSFWLLACGAAFQGASRAFFSGNNEALLHETLALQKREHEFPELLGKTRSMYQLAEAIAALIGGILAIWSLRLAVWVSVGPQIVCLLVSFFFVEPKVVERVTTNIFTHMRDAFRQFASNARLRLVSLSSIVQFGVGESMFYIEPAFVAALWPAWGIGIYRMLDHSLGWMSYWFAGRFIKKHSPLPSLLAATCYISVLGLVAFGFPTVISPVLLAATSIVYGVIIVSQNTLLQREFSDRQRATLGSINSLLGSICFGGFSILLGFLADVWSPAKALLFSQIVLLSVLFLYRSLFAKRLNSPS